VRPRAGGVEGPGECCPYSARPSSTERLTAARISASDMREHEQAINSPSPPAAEIDRGGSDAASTSASSLAQSEAPRTGGQAGHGSRLPTPIAG
jgi:hypothetical protein